MKNFGVILTFVSIFGWAFHYSLTTTLNEMTERDCEAGVIKACQSLENSR